MARKANNKLLRQAKKAKNDEFYTQLSDVERELQFYHEHFRDKTVYCNCDDPRISNFFKYFALNFKKLGLRKLIASCYQEQPEQSQDTDLCRGSAAHGFFYEYHGREGETTQPALTDLHYFEGNGDFRSEESKVLLQEADIVVTNPPFSLFREYVAQLIAYQKKFLIIGNINAITYKEIFGLIQDNAAWLGVNLGRGISGFIVPAHYELYGTESKVDEQGNRIVASNNCLWLTNLENSQRHQYLSLTKRYRDNEDKYPKYDNYNGINVDKTQDIPVDYAGYMGVPITFLHKFNPEQFEIIKFRKGDDGKDLSIKGKCPYFRVIIKHKKALSPISSSAADLALSH